MSGARSGSVLLLVVTFAAATAYAQALRDPMRPPSFTVSAREGGKRASPGPVLQSVIVSGGRRLALIDGRTYTIGDKLGDAKLVAISAFAVTLRESGGNKVLRLTPDAQKAIVAPVEGSSRTPGIKGRK